MEHELQPAKGAHRHRRRIGRGDSSGRGTYAGKGVKGQKARTGGGVRPSFEGGQLSLVKRLPHLRGFTNPFRVEYVAVNVDQLASFEAKSSVTPPVLAQRGIIKGKGIRVKVLGRGDLDRPLIVVAHRFSRTAMEKIQAAGGEARRI